MGGFKGCIYFSDVHITFSEARLAHWVPIVVFYCFVFFNVAYTERLCKRL